MSIKKIKWILITLLPMALFSCGKRDGFAPSLVDIVPDTAPGDLVITSPILLSAITNADLVITGTCQNGTTVFLTGSSEQSTNCASQSFSITVSKTSGGTYFFNLYQTNSYGTSATVSVSWVYDISAPALVTISSPLSNPYTSGDSTLNISGSCESDATVSISGDHAASTTCTGGTFQFSGITKSVDSTYSFNIVQTDAATNASAVNSFVWIRDTTIPPTPTITNFTENPRYTNASPLVVQGGCVSGNTVVIVEAGVPLASGTCGVGNTYSLNVAKVSNGSYALSVFQTDAVSLNDSAPRDFTWVFDSVAPVAPDITSPSTSPVTASGSLTISGLCETNATVNLSGDDVQSMLCSSGSFSFDISESVDATYNYSLSQVDRAGNVSVLASQQWIRDANSLPLPTIDVPSIDPFISNSVNLTLSGICQSGLTVVLSGVSAVDVVSPAGSLSTLCTGGTYSYSIGGAEGTYSLSVYQTNSTINSGSVTRSWTKDTTEPNTTLSSTPSATNYSTTANFVFSANEASTFECRLNTGSYATCTSPLSLTNLANGAYTLSVRAIDQAANIESTPATFAWTQSANNTIALYRFDSTPGPMIDSSNYGGGQNNGLTDSGSALLASAVFNEGRTMATTSNFAFVADTPSQRAIGSFLTIEGRVRLTGLPASYAPLVSKVNTASSLASFEAGIRRQGSKYLMYFRGSLNGTSFTETKSTFLSNAEEAALTAGFNHVAVTFNKGTVKYFFNGVAKGSSTIGTVGSAALAGSNAALRIGFNGTNSLNGSVDEIRISQIVRYNAGFTPAATAFTAD